MPSSLKPTRDSGLRIRVAPEDVIIRDWPLVQRPGGAIAALALAAAASCLVGWQTARWELGAAAGAALALILWRTWLPVRYELGSGGIVRVVLGRRLRIPWTAIPRYELREDGVLLLPDAVATPLSSLRGLYLHWGRQKEPVLAALDYYLGNWGFTLRHSTAHERPPAAGN
jgi:hypothetical protein